MQNKIANYLVKNYDNILIGNISTKSIVESIKTSNNNKKIANILKMYKFRMKLRTKCIEYNKNYRLVDEYDTTKKCSNCGIKNEVGKSKIYRCKSCKKEYDRDINACKNILKKAL